MKRKCFDPLDEGACETLNELIVFADKSKDKRNHLFSHLGFETDNHEKWFRRYLPASFQRLIANLDIDRLIRRLRPLVASPIRITIWSVSAFLICLVILADTGDKPKKDTSPTGSATSFANTGDNSKKDTSPTGSAARVSTFIFAILAFGVSYYRWELAEKNRNVDDAMRRKELANKMIVDHANILRPYVENVFDIDERYADTILKYDDRIKVQMYIFTEIDNLEFVFDKSRYGLIQSEYALRAIKVFVARAENSGFEHLARGLVNNGRYNQGFVRCVESLLDLGYWIRTQASRC